MKKIKWLPKIIFINIFKYLSETNLLDSHSKKFFNEQQLWKIECLFQVYNWNQLKKVQATELLLKNKINGLTISENEKEVLPARIKKKMKSCLPRSQIPNLEPGFRKFEQDVKEDGLDTVDQKILKRKVHSKKTREDN